MSLEALKEVLLTIKGHARRMRKGKLERRLNGKPKVEVAELEVAPIEDEKEEAIGGMEVELPADEPEMAMAESEEAVEPSADDEEAKALEEIRKLLARS